VGSSYWVSGWMSSKDVRRLERALEDLSRTEDPVVLIDIEAPLLRPWMFLNFHGFKKRLCEIRKVLSAATINNIEIYTAEYPIMSGHRKNLWEKLGLTLSGDIPRSRIPMCYSSIIKRLGGHKLWRKIKQLEKGELAESEPKRKVIGLGILARGTFKLEPVMNLQSSKEDLLWAKDSGYDEVVFYRLLGFTRKHSRVIENTIGQAYQVSNPSQG
jgi:hypothetical protein